MTADPALLSLELPSRAEAASAARKALTTLNGAMHLVSEARLRDAQLIATELVTNAFRHAGAASTTIRMEVRATPESLRVVVLDAGPGFAPDQLERPSASGGGGWGIPLVAALAHRWGVETGALTSVWFEIDRPQRKAAVVPSATPPS